MGGGRRSVSVLSCRLFFDIPLRGRGQCARQSFDVDFGRSHWLTDTGGGARLWIGTS